MANARKFRLIYANKRKTDEVDAENLARLARVDPKLLYPLKHRGEDSQAHMAIVRSRQALVDCRTQLVSHVPKERSSPSGPACPSARQGASTSERPSTSPRRFCWPSDPSSSRSACSPSASVNTIDNWKTMAKERYPETELLRQVEGIGPLTALTFVLTVGGSPPFREEPLGRNIPGARARHQPLGRAEPPKNASPRRARRC